MTNKINPSADLQSVGAWNPDLLNDKDKIKTINVKPSEITRDQLIQLYLLLYPFLAAEFVHRKDLQSWAQDQLNTMQEKINQMNKQLQSAIEKFNNHMHFGNLGAPTSPPQEIFKIDEIKLEPWNELPEDSNYKFGETLIVDKSKYTSILKHRDPTADIGIKLKISSTPNIKEEYKNAKLYSPYDVLDNLYDTGENNFVHSLNNEKTG